MDTTIASDTLLSPEGPSQVARSLDRAEADELERGGASGEVTEGVSPPAEGPVPSETSTFSDDATPEIVRLPGEQDLSELGESKQSENTAQAGPSLHVDPRPGTATAARPKPGRSNLLTGTAIGVIVLLFGGAFLVSRLNHVMPLPPRVVESVHHLAAQAGLDGHLLAPAAKLAEVKLPPEPKTIVRPKYTPPPKSQQLAEIVSLHAGSKAAPTASHGGGGATGREGSRPEPKVVTASPSAPTEPGMVAAERAASVASEPKPKAVAATSPMSSGAPASAKPQRISIAQALAEQAASKAEVPAAKATHPSVASVQSPSSPAAPAAAAPVKPDALTVASHLQAAPMTPHSQIKVLQLVMQMAAMLQTQRTAIAELQSAVQTSTTTTTAELSDFERRLTLLEATKAVAAAEATPLRIPLAAKPAPAKQPVKVTHADAVLAIAPQGAKRYRLQAASPGLAMLAEVGRGGGAGAQLEVQVGDTIPGYGRVESISQQGTAWVVVTQHGDIR